MPLNALLQLNSRGPHLRAAIDALTFTQINVQLEGLSSAAKAFFLAGLLREWNRPALVISYNTEQAERLVEDLVQFGFSDEEVLFLPATDDAIFEEGTPDFHAVGERLAALDALSSGKRAIVVGPVNAVLQRTMPVSELAGAKKVVAPGETLDVDGFLLELVQLGYERVQLVDRPGEFSRRGGIVRRLPAELARSGTHRAIRRRGREHSLV